MVANTMSFNNGGGINLMDDQSGPSTNHILYEISLFNNTSGMTVYHTSTETRYYGNIKIFGNSINID